MPDPKRQPHDPSLFAVDEAGRGFTEIGLRDLFAAFAAAGILSMHADENSGQPQKADVARDAYGVADALLRHREVPS